MVILGAWCCFLHILYCVDSGADVCTEMSVPDNDGGGGGGTGYVNHDAMSALWYLRGGGERGSTEDKIIPRENQTLIQSVHEKY